MKKLNNINIPSCTSEDSTSNMEFLTSSSTSTSTSSTSSTTTNGGRAIDRHNPIITDEKRNGFSNNCSTNNTPIRTPLTNNVLQKKPTTPIINPKTLQSTLKNKGNTNKKLPTFTKRNPLHKLLATKPPIYSSSKNIIINGENDDHNKSERRSFSKPSDLIMKAGVDYISPPESSRYLLDDDASFLKVLSDFDPVLKLMPNDIINNNPINNFEILNVESSKPHKSSSSSGPLDQVVVLRVSLHCGGCERKMKKHLSRMPGVRSFNIDFAAKKVTVVGDVTPLGVLTSISKVKTAQLWTPPLQSSAKLNFSRKNAT